MLEVISGPCQGLQHSMQSTNTSRLPLTLGRVTPSDILLKDSEISGKHAMINWNINVRPLKICGFIWILADVNNMLLCFLVIYLRKKIK